MFEVVCVTYQSNYVYDSNPINENLMDNILYKTYRRNTHVALLSIKVTYCRPNVGFYCTKSYMALCLVPMCPNLNNRPITRHLCVCVWGGVGGSHWFLGPFMITRGLSCDRVGFGHFVGGHPTLATGLNKMAEH